MRILWFAPTPCIAEDYLNKPSKGGGWLYSLNKQLQKNNHIELGIGFYTDEKMNVFKYERTKFYPIYDKISKIIKCLIKLNLKRIAEYENDLSALFNVIDDFNPDIIHIHGTESNFGLIAKIVTVPVVISIQGNYIVYSHKYYSGISEYSTKRFFDYKNRIVDIRYFYNNHKIFIDRAKREKIILNNCKYVLGRTNWDRSITRILAPKSKYFHSDEILKEAFYKKKWLHRKTKDLILSSTTSPAIYKGLETIFQTATLLNRYDLKFTWNIAGISEDHHLVRLIKHTMKIKDIPLNVYLKGYFDANQLTQNIINSDVFVFASHIENSPNILCEAMILGVPIVSTFVGGVGSLLQDGKEGILVQDGDPWAMAGAIIELQNNPQKAKLFGRNARVKALRRHDPERITDDLIKTYATVINEYSN